jgi:hypothetical protein
MTGDRRRPVWDAHFPPDARNVALDRFDTEVKLFRNCLICVSSTMSVSTSYSGDVNIEGTSCVCALCASMRCLRLNGQTPGGGRKRNP